LAADTVRLASFDTELSRDGPGLLLRDILRGEDPQVLAVIEVIREAAADILLLQGIDFDADAQTLMALLNNLAQAGAPYPYFVHLRPNTGEPTGLDINRNGRFGEPRDAQGYGRFNGADGIALLSRYPIDYDQVLDFSHHLWADVPGSTAPQVLPAAALGVQRLAQIASWDVPILLPQGTVLHILATGASPPVFDGPEDRNGLRNADELRFWQLYLDSAEFDADHFALMGTLNLDPDKGEGRREVMRALLNDPSLQDPIPVSAGAARAGAPADTADWDEPVPGNLRVDYILPAAGLTVLNAGVLWPEDEAQPPGIAVVERASRHRLVWVDVGEPVAVP
jgi:endonuclease/exonuclease/phosphatase family metal-dependent hydrolase